MAAPTSFGRYVLLDQLATGGMAEIFLARDSQAGSTRTCVIKRVLPHLAENDDFLEMFLDEARIAARLHHPGIVRILDLGRQGDDYFFAMEYIAGEDCATIAWRCKQLGRRIPVPVAMKVASLAADALHHAHEATDDKGRPLNVVHRDVSPSNVMVTYEGAVKLLDFGIARAEQRLYETRVAQIKGKAAYLAPEQAYGRPVDRRADVWALAVCLSEWIRGDHLFARGTWLETVEAVRTGPVPSVGAGRLDVPDELQALLSRALDRDPEHRLPSARALHEGLERILAGGGRPPDLGEFLRDVFGDERARARLSIHQVVDALPPELVESTEIQLPTEFRMIDRPPSAPSSPRVELDEGFRTDPHRQGEATRVTSDPRRVRAVESSPSLSLRTAPGVVRRWWWMGAAIGVLTAGGLVAGLGLYPQEGRAPAGTATGARTAAPVRPPPLPPPLSPPPVVAPVRAEPPVAVAVAEEPPKAADEPETAEPRSERSKRRTRQKEVALVERAAFLSLDANEPMNVSVDGAAVGTVPLKRLKLTPGEHRVKLDNRVLGVTRLLKVGLRAGEDVSRHEVFQKGRLNVSSQPWADVFVDGKKLGTTPLAAREVWEGKHSVRLVGPQSEKTVNVEILAGQTAVVKETLP